MTPENFEYRTSPHFLRNTLHGTGKYDMPLIPKPKIVSDDFINLRLIGFDKIKADDTEHFNRMVHFFLYDYKFEKIWKEPEKYIETLKKYKAVFTPDFSMYTQMHKLQQLYNTFKNRWCGAFLASKGIRVIPTVSWGLPSTFDFCFEGIEKGSCVAVSTYMVSEHNNHSDQKEFFMTGYNEMLKRIEPEYIICYHEPFPEMEGNIICVNYELSSWRYFNTDEAYRPSKYFEYISGIINKPKNCDIIKSYGYVLANNFKGMGSAYGGDWKPSPNKSDDARFLGEPGEKKVIFNRKGEKIETKIGADGKATKERHYSVHHNPKLHTNPHDHEIDWSNGYPNPSSPINYYDGVPEFKFFRGDDMSKEINIDYLDDSLNFLTISDFKWCMQSGGEVEFCWKGKVYCAFGKLQKTPDSNVQMYVSEAYKPETEKWCDNADEVLEYVIDGQRLREIITKVKVWDRTI
ncbi:MAG: DUF4417 domain-containing protein [Clostridia bacterium]|nr:DUF4417 domain-containing protein [Clostridia bacterium]MBQ6144027.1 DUF4417 domain-containing protein [Clostridia bacterium]